jgi:beta-lactamase class A
MEELSSVDGAHGSSGQTLVVAERRGARFVGVALLTLVAIVPAVRADAAPVAPVAPVSPVQERASGCGQSPFTSGFDQAVRARWPGKRITAAVYDTRTGCQHRYNSSLRITTASVLKIEIMAAVILRAQRAGRALTATERSLIGPMIRTSDDPSANALWSSVGGTSGLAALDRELGLDETRQTSPWGLTSTSAADRNELLRQLVLGQWGPFSAASRTTARSFLLDVAPSQRWGITAGVPSSWRVPLKNGFFPASCCGWRINTSGVVERPGGGAYVATVLSDGWPDQAAGIEAVEFVSKVIASWNLVDVGPHRSPAEFARQAVRDVSGRSATFAQEQDVAWRVGAEPSRAGTELARQLGAAEVDATSGQLLRLYLGVLHRLPEASTWSGRVAQLRDGSRTLVQLADAVAWSPELAGGAPLTTAEFVDRAHERVFGRRPSSADRAWWVARIDGGAPRGTLLVSLIGTATYRWASWQQVKVAGAHLAVLRRLPTPAEVATWEPRLWAGEAFSALTGALLASPGYRARFS